MTGAFSFHTVLHDNQATVREGRQVQKSCQETHRREHIFSTEGIGEMRNTQVRLHVRPQTAPNSPWARWHPQLQASPLNGTPTSLQLSCNPTLSLAFAGEGLSLPSNLIVSTAHYRVLSCKLLFSQTPEVLTWFHVIQAWNLTILLTQLACPMFKQPPPNPSGFSSSPGFFLMFSYIPVVQTIVKLMTGLQWISTNQNLANSYNKTVDWVVAYLHFPSKESEVPWNEATYPKSGSQ